MGIICLETEWEHTSPKNKMPLHTEPLLEFLGKAWKRKFIYRRVATFSEMLYYLKKFNTKKNKADYPIFYLSFHGDTQSIFLEAGSLITLDRLVKMADGCFEGRHVHFSSCRTLLGGEKQLLEFKKAAGAKSVSGYTKKVDGVLSAINDIAYIDQIFRHPIKPAYAEQSMLKYYNGLGAELGFKVL